VSCSHYFTLRKECEYPLNLSVDVYQSESRCFRKVRNLVSPPRFNSRIVQPLVCLLYHLDYPGYGE
jgi:hypothetical protein